MRKWLPRAYGTHHNTASTARNDKNPTREFRRINPGPILLKVASTVPNSWAECWLEMKNGIHMKKIVLHMKKESDYAPTPNYHNMF